jgi:hypothetical protein
VWFQGRDGLNVMQRPFLPTQASTLLAVGGLGFTWPLLPLSLRPATEPTVDPFVIPASTPDGPRLQVWPSGPVLGFDDDVLIRPGRTPGTLRIFTR